MKSGASQAAEEGEVLSGNLIREWAAELGFCAAGIGSVEPFERHAAVALERIQRGLMAGLPWYTPGRVQWGCQPTTLLPSARSILSVATPYLVADEEPSQGLAGRMSRYARGLDYHPLMKERLRLLVSRVEKRLGRPIQSRVYVDDSPMPDRAVAERAGVGWFGKNTCILVPDYGSWVFLGEALVDADLEPDRPLAKSCGRCTLCLEACPTGALVAPYVLDCRRCISYLTVENRGPIPRELRPRIGDRLFGCDACQEACPVNQKTKPAGDIWWRGPSALKLTDILEMQPEEFDQRFRNSPLRRARLAGLQRNACVVLGNLGDRAAVPVLTQVLEKEEALVRGHAAWALGRLGGKTARQALERALHREGDALVLEEVRLARVHP